ncbi:hypothetical protein FE257_007125 [Aspergillus nanangensis]|uniref:FAD-binding PCMH-type domain-containing protein n=1 Tax=Aspergillus nanangensis TaxID=2582783 RepID=A0AAD4GUD1_ASPNN|nr:hypothetical protein FE257_007125 [Aspergillus nanangensis]
MSPSASLPELLGFLQLAAPAQGVVEAALSAFASLSEAEQESARATTIAQVFPQVFGESAVVEGSSSYEAHRTQPWSTNCWLAPTVIVNPSSSTEVAQVLALAQFLRCKFSVRGGGHLQNPGFNSNEGGIVISMSKFTQLVVADDKSTVDVGLGLRWLDVYQGLEPHGITVAGGRVPPVGVPGLLLGGGLSFQNSEYGLGCTNVIEYEVVLADSSVVRATQQENPDLFWALKGGGPNFGVVTKMIMQAIPNKVWSEGRVYAGPQNFQLLDALMKYHEIIEKDNKATLIWYTLNQVTLIVFFYCAPVETPDAFKPFYDIPFLQNVVPPSCRTVSEMCQAIANVMAADQQYHDMRTMSSLPSLEVYQAAENARLEQVEALKDIEGADLTMVFQPMASSAIKAGELRGGNPMGLKAENHQWLLVLADYKKIEHEERVRESVRKIVDAAETTAKANGTYLPFKYSNYASRDQDPLASYGAENLQKLKDLAVKYDPQGIFQTLQSGGWLVSKAGTAQ